MNNKSIHTLEKIVQLLTTINNEHNKKLLSNSELKDAQKNLDAIKNNFDVFLRNIKDAQSLDFSCIDTEEATVPLGWGYSDMAQGINNIKKLISIAQERNNTIEKMLAQHK